MFSQVFCEQKKTRNAKSPTQDNTILDHEVALTTALLIFAINRVPKIQRRNLDYRKAKVEAKSQSTRSVHVEHSRVLPVQNAVTVHASSRTGADASCMNKDTAGLCRIGRGRHLTT
jgi:hypothetical protein